MRVKRFVAPTVNEAMYKLKAEMGKDAIILNTRKIKEGGIFGFFAKEMVEITGAVEAIPLTKLVGGPVINKTDGNRGLIRPEPISNKGLITPNQGITGIKTELRQLRTMMSEVLGRLDQDHWRSTSQNWRQLEERLVGNEVERSIAGMLVRDVLENHRNPEDCAPGVVKTEIIERIATLLGEPKPLVMAGSEKRQEVVVVIGPTGVGKTTTIAKMAATFAIVDKKNVGLITADTYRIAAVEQLRTFGEIIGVPVEVVFSPPALRAAIERSRDKDLLLIDTAGRSHKNTRQMEELQAFIAASQPSQSLLVLSVTTKYRDLLQIIEHYTQLNVDRLLFTKLDETNHLGTILNVAYTTGKPLSYITVGQNVPDDIEIAEPYKLANLIFGETS
ncbi:MAG: flagellar biosynthesis protein FlhF [Heliobacteriaceae bacterium]|nr:flagellar biosynthesis protein FlhF [Heliobacteriaceae bacterium]MDD4587224.1 flagellar biosynthesis protein FlhF [Heliobacteriaceae bacterium]